MPSRSITVELDERTFAALAALGKPVDVLTQLAHSAADGLHASHRKRRELTNESLRSEREQADIGPADRRDNSLSAQRRTTDDDLTGERAQVDTTMVDQREANAQMVRSSIRAHDLALEAAVARERAEGSERELRAVAELRELFIGILGHDLRNPLSAIILAAASMQRRGHLDQQDAETAARIVRAAQRITRMISQLLDLTRARLGGGLAIERKPVDLGDICRNVIEEFDTPIQLEIEGDVAGSWDPDRLAEVLSNLAGNAIEYHAPQTPVIVRARDSGPDVVVEISNEGPLIPADQLRLIFEPFRRVNPHEKPKTGLGLGLYIANQIVLAHGGTLDVRSADHTTTFTMRLPHRA